MPGQPEKGSIFAGHRIERLIARGGMGVVYEAEQLSLGRRVAIKVIAPELAEDATFRERFTRESRLTAQIDHPNVIPVYEAGEADGHLYLAMRLVRGNDLRAILASEGRLAPERIARVIPQIAAALDAAHAAGLVHRDVKPGNVLVSGAGDEEHAYLTDFGLTKDAGSKSGLTHTGQWVGTVDYVAPEQIEGHPVDARTDTYALGAMLFHLAAGRPPFTGAELAKMWAHVQSDPPRLAEVAPEAQGLDSAVARAMAKDPDERYPSCGDLGRAVSAAIEGRPVAAPERSVASGPAAAGIAPADETEAAVTRPHDPTAATLADEPAPQPTAPTAGVGAAGAGPRPGRRHMWLIGAAGALILLAAGIAAGVVLTRDDEGPASATVTPGEGAPEAEPVDDPPETPEPGAAPVRYTEYTPPHRGWTAQVPRGAGWSRPADSEPTPGELLRTTINGPDGLVAIIDYTPFEPARFGGDHISQEQIGQPAFGSATEYVFRGGVIPQCQAITCVDIIINDEVNGQGYGILVGGSEDVERSREIARRISDTLTP